MLLLETDCNVARYYSAMRTNIIRAEDAKEETLIGESVLFYCVIAQIVVE